MPKREETSQVRDTPLEVWMHTDCILGGAHVGSVAKSYCLICPCVMLCREEGSAVLRECWAASRICLQTSKMGERVLAGSLIFETYFLLKGLFFPNETFRNILCLAWTFPLHAIRENGTELLLRWSLFIFTFLYSRMD